MLSFYSLNKIAVDRLLTISKQKKVKTLPAVKKLNSQPKTYYDMRSGEAFVYTYKILVW